MSSALTTITMSTLIDEVLDIMYRPVERPRQVEATAAITDSDSSLIADSVSAANLAATDLLEFGRELMLVTAVAGTTITVSRGYNGTTAAAHAINSLGNINPLYPRHLVDREIRKCVRNSMQKELPCILSETVVPNTTNNEEAMRWIDDSWIDILDVRYVETTTFRVTKLRGNWYLEDWLPDDVSPTGKSLRVPRGYWDKDLIVTYTALYTWTAGATLEADTLSIPLMAADLPVLFAVARLSTGSEVSRQEFDQIEEWPNQERNQRSANIRLLQALWGQYYQQLDTAKGMQSIPLRKSYQRMSHR